MGNPSLENEMSKSSSPVKKYLFLYKFGLLVCILFFIFAGTACSKRLQSTMQRDRSEAQKKIVGFHIDMNIKQFTDQYLRNWLKELAGRGYNTIIWEVQDNIKWQTCPECVSPDAFSKEEFKDLLAYSRKLGLEPIPLLQTIGHCEYVLKHDKYKNLAEVAERIDQYCPRNPDTVLFLKKWIAEYLEVFGDVKRFHLGADEAYTLGHCNKCKAYTKKHSLSELYIDHINAVSEPLIKRGIQPIIWADMMLHYPEEIDKLSRRIMMFDWMYDIYHGRGKVMVWGKGYKTKSQIDSETMENFGEFLFPYACEPGREPETFYTADYLAHNGFDTVTCPSSSSYGDNVFSPRNYYHMRNTFDSFHKGSSEHLKGSVLTSWTVHLFPWQLQKVCIEMPEYIMKNPEGLLDDYEQYFVEKHFGISHRGFFKACGLLSKKCLFTYTNSLGYYKSAFPASPNHVQRQLDKIAERNGLDAELRTCRQRLEEYKQGLNLLNEYSKKAKKGQELLRFWKLAARNLINRAETSICIIEDTLGIKTENAADILKRLRQLKKETYAIYDASTKHARRDEIMAWIYEPYEQALEKIYTKGE